MDLFKFIDTSRVRCLNQDADHPGAYLSVFRLVAPANYVVANRDPLLQTLRRASRNLTVVPPLLRRIG
jgi:hypothetical protein